MLRIILVHIALIFQVVVSVRQTRGIIQLNRWPKATPIEVPESSEFVGINCFTEITPDLFNKALLVNTSNLRLRKPCMIRIPTQTEVIFSVAAVDRRSSLRVLSGNSFVTQHMATPSLVSHTSADPDFTNPIFVGCSYATIVYKPHSLDDQLFFIIKEARPELVVAEDQSKCGTGQGSTSQGRSKRTPTRLSHKFIN